MLPAFFVLMVSGCFDGGGSSDLGTAPSISNLSFTPAAVYVNDSGGETDIVGTFDFTDPDGNLGTLVLTVIDAAGQTVISETVAIDGVQGLVSGTIQGMLTVPTLTAGFFTVRIYVTDNTGLDSNIFEFVFRIAEFPWLEKSAMPTPRLEFSTAVIDGLVYVIGGRDALSGLTPKPVVSTVEVYDPLTDSWTTAPSLPVALARQMTVASSDRIYAAGGEELFLESDLVQQFDPATQTWTQKTSMPDQRSAAAVSVNNGLIYIAGGEGPGVQLDSLLWYNPASDQWSAGSPMSQARAGAGGASIDGHILVYGGYLSTHVPDAGYLRSVESYDPVMDAWSARADGEPRRDFGITVFDNRMYAFGGNNVERTLDWAYSYDNALDQWSVKTAMPASLGFVRAETIGDRIYIFATDKTYEYTPSNDIR